jgi:hypothetical protein
VATPFRGASGRTLASLDDSLMEKGA